MGSLPNLETLMVKRNRIGAGGLDDVKGLLEIPSLSVLDIQDNKIDDEAFLEDILCKMPNLGVLYTQSNPYVKKISNFKKVVVSKIKQLKYLNDTPIFEDDRRFYEAWAAGGLEAEREERKTVKKEKDDAHERNHQAFKEMIRKAKEERM